MSPWSRRKAETEPLVAIVVVFAVVIGLTTYTGLLNATLPASTERNLARPALQEAYAELAPMGVVEPERLTTDTVNGPDGYRVRVTITTDGTEWQTGSSRPPKATVASRPVSVRVRAGMNRPGRLSVAVWR